MTSLSQRREDERAKYVQLSLTRPRYGSSCHGKDAIPLILKLAPRFLIDFGCGRNNLVHLLRAEGINAWGLDFVFPEADIHRPMHDTTVDPGTVDVITSFDALEHLLPEDVDPVLSEMLRISRPGASFIFTICTRPSKIQVDGRGLHPTVKPTSWWLSRILRVASSVEQAKGSRFIVGQFKK